MTTKKTKIKKSSVEDREDIKRLKEHFKRLRYEIKEQTKKEIERNKKEKYDPRDKD